MKKKRPGMIAKMALGQLFSKPATIAYPKGKLAHTRNYRGKILYDPSNCIDCKLCMRDCPTGALQIINEGTKKDRKMKAVLNEGQCIFCCQCVDSCPKKSLTASQEFELASQNRKDLTKPL